MAIKSFQQLEIGGVDSRSNPLNLPVTRSLRCLNWVPKQGGHIELRYGYSTFTQSTTTATAYHTLIPFRQWSGTKQLLTFQGTTTVRTVNMSGGAVTTPTFTHGNFTSAAKGGFYLANNRIHYGNGTDQKWFDGSAWRRSGIRAPTSGEASGVTVTQGATASTATPAAVLTGYQLYMSYYNPSSGQHVGNRIAIGSRLALSTASEINIGGLPDLSGVDTELVKLIGRTGDGAQVPYAIADASGNWFAVANAATNGTVTASFAGIDGNAELPTRNGVIPSGCSLFARVGDYIYAADTAFPTIRRSGSELDARVGDFVGRPEQSWHPTDIETFPTAEAVTGIAEVDYELFVGTIHDCAILTDLSGVLVWRGPWNVGLAGARAFCKTPYGFCWVSGDKQLCSFVNGVPIPISEEYEAAELSQIGDAFLSTIECAYFRDPGTQADYIKISAQKSDGTPIQIKHDFKLKDDRSPLGQGYSQQYVGPLASSFTIAQVRDSNNDLQIMAGASNGQLFTLHSGGNDGGTEFTADLIKIVDTTLQRPSIPSIDFYGDSKATVGIGKTMKTTLTGQQNNFENVTPTESPWGFEDQFLWRADFRSPEMLDRCYLRFQLTSHSSDGNLALNSPPHVPLEDYGRIYAFIPRIGEGRER